MIGMGKKGGMGRKARERKWSAAVIVMLSLACLLLWSWPSLAHHALSEYDSAHVRTIEGTLGEIRIKNPHSTLIVQASGDVDPADRWTVEWLAALVLKHEGVENTTLRPGDRLIITGNPSKDPGARRLWLRTVTRPADGWTWTGGF
jgi:hypothetical protein